MPPLSTEAIVLRSFPLGEQSNVVVLLTRARGKVRAVAKGVRGPKARYQSSLEPLSQIRTALYGREHAHLFRLGTVELVRSAVPPHGTLEGLVALEYCAELFEALSSEGAPEDDTYRLARSCAMAFRRETIPALPVLRYAEAWLLKLHGLYPSFTRCPQCRRSIDGALAFDSTTDRVVCALCRPERAALLDADSRSLLRSALRLSVANFAQRVAAIDLSPIARYHSFLLERHLGQPLKSSRVLASLT